MFGFDQEVPALGVIAQEPVRVPAVLIPENSYKHTHVTPYPADAILTLNTFDRIEDGTYNITVDKARNNPCGEITLAQAFYTSGIVEKKASVADSVTYSDYNELLNVNKNVLKGIVLDTCGFLTLPNGKAAFYDHNIDSFIFTPHQDGDILFQGEKGKTIKVSVAKNREWVEFNGDRFDENDDDDTCTYTEEEIEDIKEQCYDEGHREGYDSGYEDGKCEGYDDEAMEECREEAYERGVNDGKEEAQEDWMDNLESYIEDGECVELGTISASKSSDNVAIVRMNSNFDGKFFFIDTYHPSNRENEFDSDFEYDRDRVVTRDGDVYAWDTDKEEWRELGNDECDAEEVAQNYIDDDNTLDFGAVEVQKMSHKQTVVACPSGGNYHFVNYSNPNHNTGDLRDFEFDGDILVTSDGCAYMWDLDDERFNDYRV